MKIYKRLSKILCNINEAAGFMGWILIFMLMILGVYDVCMRYLFNSPSQWIYIILKLGMVALVAVCAGYSFQHDTWVRIDILYDRFSDKGKAIIDIICFPFIAFFLAILLWTGIERAILSAAMKQMTPTAVRIPLYHVKALIPIGVFLLIIAVINHFMEDIVRIFFHNNKQ
jgi:TRAP-type mannitol/chloroaromatic compound transport system permease small subunit